MKEKYQNRVSLLSDFVTKVDHQLIIMGRRRSDLARFLDISIRDMEDILDEDMEITLDNLLDMMSFFGWRL